VWHLINNRRFVTYYLLALNHINPDIIAGLHCGRYGTKFPLYPQNGHCTHHPINIGLENTSIMLIN